LQLSYVREIKIYWNYQYSCWWNWKLLAITDKGTKCFKHDLWGK